MPAKHARPVRPRKIDPLEFLLEVNPPAPDGHPDGEDVSFFMATTYLPVVKPSRRQRTSKSLANLLAAHPKVYGTLVTVVAVLAATL